MENKMENKSRLHIVWGKVKKVAKRPILLWYYSKHILCTRICPHIGKVTKYLEIRPIATVWVGGGFGSQIYRYALGGWFREMGFDVKYDLDWFKSPYVNVPEHDFSCYLGSCFGLDEGEVVRGWKKHRYRLFYNSLYNGVADRAKDDIRTLKAPFCVNSFEFDWILAGKSLQRYVDWWKIENILSEKAKGIAVEIRNAKQGAVAVHVRRGDMAQYVDGAYWKVLTPAYFKKALECLPKDSLKLYFFSNGMDFVKKELLGFLDEAWDVTLASDLGLVVYEELYLMSLCSTIVASQGGWGKMAFDFHKGDGLLITYSEDVESDRALFQEKYPGKREILIPLTEEMYMPKGGVG